MTNEEMLDLLRKDRPGQTIHEVKAVKAHPLNSMGVEYLVDAVLQIDNFFGTTIQRVNVQLPYPLDGWRKWKEKYGDLHSGDWSNEIMGNDE